MDRLLLLLVAAASVSAVASRAPCLYPVWQTLAGENSVNGVQVPNMPSRAACLSYCANSTTCIAVDVDQTGFPPGCWLHTDPTDLQPANVYDQTTTNQYRFQSCSSVPNTPACGSSSWEMYPDQTSTGATQYVGPRTIQQCLDFCSNNTACLAVDIDVDVVPLGCWPHYSSNDLTADNTYTQSGTYQYRLVQRCPVQPSTVCYNPEWSVLVGQSAAGGTQYIGPTSVQDCLNYCGQTVAGCVAVDVRMNTSPVDEILLTPPQCWLHMSNTDLVSSNMYQQPAVFQYRLINRCASGPITVPPPATTTTTAAPTTATTTLGPICPVGRWQMLRNQLSIGATQYVGPRTIQQCLDYCNRNTSCLAVDIDVNTVPLGCWPHRAADLTADNVYPQSGTTQYKLVTRCTNPTAATTCYNPDWSVLYNQSSTGGVQYAGPQSVQECLDYCGQTATGCVAVDVDLTKSPPACWIHLSQNDLTNMFAQIGVNQYRLITNCATYPVGATTATTTQPTTTTQGPVCPDGRWQIIPAQSGYGATQYVGPRTITQCLDYCNNRTDCLGVDIDVNSVPIGCWPHISASDLTADNTYDQPGTNQYRLLERCPNKTIATTCYNPDWQVLLGQSSTGGVQFMGATSVQQCLDYCGQTAVGCIAVDANLNQDPPTCWMHYNDADLTQLYQQDGKVNQYRLITKCANYPVGASPPTTTSTTTTTLAPVCPHGRWQQFPNQIAFGGTQFVGPRTIAQCLDYCNNRTDCVAVDIDVNDVPLGCWPHFSSAEMVADNIYPQMGTNQFVLLQRCTTPQPVSDCYNPEWTVLANQSAAGAIQYFGATSVQECLDYCGQTAVGCLAVDVNVTSVPPTCWPHFTSSELVASNMYDQPGVNQYRLATKCASSPITTTTTTTQAPLTKPSAMISPSYGPQAGGTSVNITCAALNMFNIAHVIFGGQLAPVQKSTASSVVVISPASTMLAHSNLVLVAVDGRRVPIDPVFEYRVNPVFSGIYPVNHLIVGGTLVTIIGTNLDSVAHPMIELVVQTFYPSLDLFQTAMFEKCHQPTDDTLIGKQLVCQMPPAVIPADVQSRLEVEDGMVSGSVDGGRGGVASAVETDGRTIVLNVGLVLDGVTTYNNITSTLPNLRMDFHVQPAVYCSQDSDGVVFAPKISSAISITGYELLRGCQEADYTVTVGGATCEDVSVTATSLTCKPPTVQPARTSNDADCLNGGVTVAIPAGYASYRCCIAYSSASPPNVGLIVGLTLGLVIPFLIILFIIVFCCCWYRRCFCCQHQDPDAEKSKVGAIENPNYEHSTVSATPSTSSSTAPIATGEAPPTPGPSGTVKSDTINFYWAPEKPGGTTRVNHAYTEERLSET